MLVNDARKSSMAMRVINASGGSVRGKAGNCASGAVVLVPSQPTKIRILPTGAGEARTFDVAPVHVDWYFVSWLPGATEFVFLGHEGADTPRAYRVAMAGGPARPLTNIPGAHF